VSAPAVAAVDLGATSGRVILGRIDGGRLRTQHVARFANDPVRTRDGLHWNLLELYRQALAGLALAEREAPGEIVSVGIDSWAVDYGLLRGGRPLGMPHHYRDTRCDAGVAAVHARVPAAQLYARNGLQHLPFNTVFQLAAEGDLLGLADRVLLIPDLLNYWLTGVEAAELSNASTTGLLDPRSRAWDLELASELGIPSRILPPLIPRPRRSSDARSTSWPSRRTTRPPPSPRCPRSGPTSPTSPAAPGAWSASSSTRPC
jgi:rhamnulokinase